MSPAKQIILIRSDYITNPHLLSANIAHVSFNALYAEMPTAYGTEGYVCSTLDYQEESALSEWLSNGQSMTILRVKTERELIDLTEKLSKFTPYSYTLGDGTTTICSAVGPVFDNDVDHLIKFVEKML